MQFMNGETRVTHKVDGSETFDIEGIAKMGTRAELVLEIKRADGKVVKTKVRCRIDTADELEYYRNGGILPYVVRKLS